MNKKLLINREISWLSFNARVLQEANDPTLPLKERIRFLGIHSNNVDEFFRTRVAPLKKMIQLNDKNTKQYFGKHPQRILNQIHDIVLQQQDEFNRIWKKILNELKKEKVFLVDEKHLNAKQKTFLKIFFDQELSSSIIPLFIDKIPKLPAFVDNHIFLGIMMRKKSAPLDERFAIIEIPTKNHSRFVSLPSPPGEQHIMLLEDAICFNLPLIFSHLGERCFEAHMFKVTKDAEIDIDNDFSRTFIQKIRKGLKNRRKAQAIRFLYDKEMNPRLLQVLIEKFNLTDLDSVFPGGHIRNFRDFMHFPAILPNTQHRPLPFKHPLLAKTLRIFDVIQHRDLLLHFPYHSFNSIIDLLREAAMDADVKSIKITAYRLAPNSKICNALINAARNGKKVHVYLELRASFDEEANLEWKTKLQEEGVKVFVSTPRMKVHAKICVIKRKLGKKIDLYGFIGTGNLNEETALHYSDHFLLTSKLSVMDDLNRIFKALEHPKSHWHELGLCKTLLVTPLNMREALSSLINREIDYAKAGVPSKILINLNSLSDEKLINDLYKAAAAGVQIQLIVRGIFCPVIDRKKFKHLMTAISIVDQYLEHGRIWLFHNGGDEKIYISSADWTVRNLDNRVEVAVPILNKELQDELKMILSLKLSDNVKARWLDQEHTNQFVSASGKKKVQSQLAIYHYLKSIKVKSNENSRH